MSLLHALVLGVVQGLSEFLPISSSGHLELVPFLAGWDDFAGRPDLELAFDVALHLGTLAGVVAVLWSDLVRLARAGVGSVVRRRVESRDERLAWLLVLSAVPAGLVGVLIADSLEGDTSAWLVAAMLIVFGLVLGVADRLPERRAEDTWSWRDSLIMGVAQAMALQPGVSRSGATMTAARGLGLDRSSAARLSFLMSVPVIAGAGLFQLVDVATGEGFPTDAAAPFAVGTAASAVTGAVAVWGLLRFVQTRTFSPFVTYRVLAGTAVLVVLAAGWR